MITNARVLQPEFVPNDVVHRDAELNHLASALQPITNGNPTETAFLYGPSGTGKTCIAQHTVEQLQETVLDINTQYVNCWEDYSRFKTLYRILEGIDKALDIHRQSTPTDVLLDRLHDYTGPPYVIILDEADQLEDKGVLYELYRTRNVTMVLIANQEQSFFTELSDRVKSRLQTSTRIQFEPYGNAALVSILEDRVRWGLRPDMITRDQLETIADTAAGDARVAIGILRAAASRAQQQERSEITDDLIQDAVSEAKTEIQQKTLEKLTEHQSLLYEIIRDDGELSPGELYDQYEQRATDPRSQRMVRNYLTKLVHYNLIEANGKNRGRTYQALSE
jgi:orc1/cdc6 family replication initiation protein